MRLRHHSHTDVCAHSWGTKCSERHVMLLTGGHAPWVDLDAHGLTNTSRCFAPLALTSKRLLQSGCVFHLDNIPGKNQSGVH